LTTRRANSALAALLAPQFTVFNYDRRGRGDSGDTAPYAVGREFEDLDAVITEAGGSASVIGFSSGGALALEAAAHGLPITRLALWEPPFNLDDDGPRRHMEYATRLAELLARGRRGDAVARFMTLVGLPPEMIAGARESPMWPALEDVASTLAYDAAVMGDSRVPVQRVTSVTAPTLVLDGGASPPSLRDAARAVADALPDGHHRTLEDQTHDVDPAVIAPVVAGFLDGDSTSRVVEPGLREGPPGDRDGREA
jgi:pimeloyl-ACP methyl ester carboxylesterase